MWRFEMDNMFYVQQMFVSWLIRLIYLLHGTILWNNVFLMFYTAFSPLNVCM